MPRAFCSCLVCGAQAEVPDVDGAAGSVRWSPKGWIALLAVHWPPGMPDPGPLVLRVCFRCLVRAFPGRAGG
jgi:hypothetical protein